MKANELMIGDWVMHNDAPKKVMVIWYKNNVSLDNPFVDWGSIYSDKFPIEEVLPIPLTSEILEKNGFKNDGKDKDMLYWNWSICEDCVSYDKKTGIIRIFHCLGSLIFVHALSYVHELQHALKLCGIEKEIEL